MDTLNKQIGVARRRLNLERFIGYLARAWCAWLALAVIAVVIAKFWPVGVSAKTWNAAWLIGALVAGLITAIAWTWLTRRSPLEAAIEIDKRFGLKERVSSAVTLDAETRETPAGQALVSDTLKRIERLDVAERFRVSLDRRAWWPLVPGAIAIAIVLFVHNRANDNPAIAKTAETAPQQIKKSAQALQKKLVEQREQAKKKGLEDAEALLKKLEDGTKELGEKSGADKEKALVKLNDLGKELESRKQKLGADEKFKQQLNNLKDLKQGPADAAAKAMKNGDFGKAAKELEDIKKQLADNKLDEAAKQKLAEQMEQIKDAMQKAADAHEQAKQEIEKQIEKQRQAGNTQGAEKLQQQLDKMQQQAKSMDKLKQMAQQCKECADAMKQGNAENAQKALDQLSKDLQAMQQSKEEMAMLNEALDDIAAAKQGMTGDGDKKDGDGLDGDMMGGMQGGKGKKDGPPGKGMGEGRGKGERPEEATKTGFYDSQVKQKVGKGAGVVTDLVDGPNRKGEVTETIKSAFEAAKKESADPLTGERLPRDYRDHAKEYFDAFRKGGE